MSLKPHIVPTIYKGMRKWRCWSSRDVVDVGTRQGSGYTPTEALRKWGRASRPHYE